MNNKKTKPTVVAMKLKEKKELFESLNYVLPIEKFNNFKVLIPKSKLHLITKDGEKVVVEYPGKRLNTKVCILSISLYYVNHSFTMCLKMKPMAKVRTAFC